MGKISTLLQIIASKKLRVFESVIFI